MALSRRFVNLILKEGEIGVTSSLCSIDLRRLFYAPGTPPPPPADVELEELSLPARSFSFRTSRHGILPVADRKVLCTNRDQRAFLVDAATRQVTTIPTRRAFKGMPVAVFVPSAGAGAGDDGDPDPDGTLYVMEVWPEHEARSPDPESAQFEALVYRRASASSAAKSWRSQLFPPLPYLRNPRYWKINVGIESYAVLGGGSHIAVSLEPSFMTSSEERLKLKREIAGTYCLDTATHTWSKVGEWKLPFDGKAEYVPELKLWFGISSCGGGLAAADLSAAMDSYEPPQLVGVWSEINGGGGAATCMKRRFEKLYRWSSPKLAHLGSGKFCIATFLAGFGLHNSNSIERVDVLTGVEVTPPQVHGGSGDDGAEAKPKVIWHKSRVVPSDIRIDAVF